VLRIARYTHGVIATPSALRISGDGRIASALAIGQDAIMQLARERPVAARAIGFPPARE
jgi:hypothetical protein